MRPFPSYSDVADAPRQQARTQLFYELVSGLSGLALALFMWGHLVLVGSILLGARGFDWLAGTLEDLYIAQPTVPLIVFAFLVHAVLASRKIPAQLRERKRMVKLARDLQAAGRGWPTAEGVYTPFQPHLDSLLWIWQVRTGMAILVIGSFHLVLLGLDVFTPLFGARIGIESATTLARVGGGLWPLYALLLLCVEFHASTGLYRLATKWGVGARLSRRALWTLERILFWTLLGLGTVTLAVLAGWLAPPLAFLLETAA